MPGIIVSSEVTAVHKIDIVSYIRETYRLLQKCRHEYIHSMLADDKYYGKKWDGGLEKDLTFNMGRSHGTIDNWARAEKGKKVSHVVIWVTPLEAGKYSVWIREVEYASVAKETRYAEVEWTTGKAQRWHIDVHLQDIYGLFLSMKWMPFEFGSEEWHAVIKMTLAVVLGIECDGQSARKMNY